MIVALYSYNYVFCVLPRLQGDEGSKTKDWFEMMSLE